jgi:RND family efflux transporter MFP subunit
MKSGNKFKLWHFVIALTVVASALATSRNPVTAAPEAASKAALTVTLVHPEKSAWPQKIVATGNIQPWQEAVIGAEVSGLKLIEINAEVGDSVRRGQVLARFTDDVVANDVAQQRAILEDARAKLAEAEANETGSQKLKGSAAMSAQEFNQYSASAQSARAQVQIAAARLQSELLRLNYTRVTAPDDGVISSRAATLGAVMQNGGELFRMIRRSRLEWRADLPEAQLHAITPGQKVLLNGASGAGVTGTVRRVSPLVDSQTRNGMVYVDLAHAPGLKAGMFAQGEFILGNTAALTLPQAAVVVRDGYSYVYRVGEGQRVTQVKVITGRRLGGRIEVTGVKPDDPLVASGAGFLTDGDTVRVEKTAIVPSSSNK